MLSELFATIVEAVAPMPSTDRGSLKLFVVVGSAAILVQVWLRVSAGSPADAAEWAWPIYIASMLSAVPGFVLGLVTLWRRPCDVALALACVGMNAVSLALTPVFTAVG